MPSRSTPSARVVADSLSPAGQRLTTIAVRLHRFVLAELNTHRAFSRNAASSRAVPVAKVAAAVLDDPALPVEFGTARPGMQAGPPLVDDAEARRVWLEARDAAVAAAQQLLHLGVHKQVANRLLEPFSWQSVIVTATEWDGFFEQRCSPLAPPEIRLAATAMRDAYRRSEPRPVPTGGWHLPFVDPQKDQLDEATLCRVSAARCARVSYLTHDGRRSLADDLRLYETLVSAAPPHVSPLEHVATPTAEDQPSTANFQGWVQLRHLVLAPPSG